MKNNNCNNKIDTYTSFNNINSNYWYNNNETTTLIRTIQNWENEKQLDYNVVIVSISSCYPVIQSCLCLCMCILLIITLRLLGQSVGSVKIQKDQVDRASQMRLRLKARLESYK